MTGAAKVRAWIACFVLAACFGVFIVRLCVLQVLRHEHYSQLAQGKHGTKKPIPAKRGVILDCNDEILADNLPVQTIAVDGKVVADREGMAELLSSALAMSKEELLKRIDPNRRYVVLKRRVPDTVAEEIEVKMIERAWKGLIFEPENIRIYPNGSMLCHVLGYLDSNYQGMQGIEKTMDDFLRGYDGFLFTERDAKGRELVQYRGLEHKPRNGSNVRLTVDMGLQHIVESELSAACAQYRPKLALAILMRPQTGEILAMANRPNFDPVNAIKDNPEEAMKNASIINMMEPGSTFKIVTTAAALNEKKVSLDTSIFCENGHFSYAGKVLHDHHGYGDLSVEDILVKSSNIGVAKLAIGLGDSKFYEYIRSFGFGERTGIALPGEIKGVVHPVQNWSKISISRIPMGQGVSVTPIQTVAAMSAIANGGSLMMPQIIRDIRDGEGNVIKNFEPVVIRKPVSAEVAKQVTKALKDVVSARGTAAAAKVPGFTVAGKTGTANMPNPKGGYYDNKYVLSFVGYMPADDPAFVGLVIIQEPSVRADACYGGTVCAPVFSKIAEKAARYLNLQPEPEVPQTNLLVTKSGEVNKKPGNKIGGH